MLWPCGCVKSLELATCLVNHLICVVYLLQAQQDPGPGGALLLGPVLPSEPPCTPGQAGPNRGLGASRRQLGTQTALWGPLAAVEQPGLCGSPVHSLRSCREGLPQSFLTAIPVRNYLLPGPRPGLTVVGAGPSAPTGAPCLGGVRAPRPLPLADRRVWPLLTCLGLSAGPLPDKACRKLSGLSSVLSDSVQVPLREADKQRELVARWFCVSASTVRKPGWPASAEHEDLVPE